VLSDCDSEDEVDDGVAANLEDGRVSLKYLSNACFFIFSIFQTDAFSHLD
jgi:hypothetical protein